MPFDDDGVLGTTRAMQLIGLCSNCLRNIRKTEGGRVPRRAVKDVEDTGTLISSETPRS